MLSSTRSTGRKHEERLERAGSLVLAMEGARPLVVPALFSIVEITEVILGRGADRGADRKTPTLRIEIPDPWMSVTHARLRLEGGAWSVADAGSKNGTYVNGVRIDETEIEDGDRIETGGTIFILRPGWPPVAPPLEARDEPRAVFRTLVPSLAKGIATLVRVARAPLPLLIHGESGTGKELLSRAVHETSRRSGPFVPVNCAALPANLVESELFGARKGAFSGALADRAGLIASAHQGTLLLDEIAELPEAAQASLLRVLQDREVRPLGGTTATKVDVRVIAATHVDLAARVEQGRFRRDLFGRLRGYRFTLPPLRDRLEDLGLVCADILRRIDPERAPRLRIEGQAGRALFSYGWPMNMRELEHALRAACAIAPGDEIELAHLPEELREEAGESPARTSSTVDHDSFLALVRAHKGNSAAVARALSTSRSQVRRLAKRFGVDLEAERAERRQPGDET